MACQGLHLSVEVLCLKAVEAELHTMLHIMLHTVLQFLLHTLLHTV